VNFMQSDAPLPRGPRERLGLLEGLFAGELFRPKAPVRIVV